MLPAVSATCFIPSAERLAGARRAQLRRSREDHDESPSSMELRRRLPRDAEEKRDLRSRGWLLTQGEQHVSERRANIVVAGGRKAIVQRVDELPVRHCEKTRQRDRGCRR
jgi:hypothetical protein